MSSGASRGCGCGCGRGAPRATAKLARAQHHAPCCPPELARHAGRSLVVGTTAEPRGGAHARRAGQQPWHGDAAGRKARRGLSASLAGRHVPGPCLWQRPGRRRCTLLLPLLLCLLRRAGRAWCLPTSSCCCGCGARAASRCRWRWWPTRRTRAQAQTVSAACVCRGAAAAGRAAWDTDTHSAWCCVVAAAGVLAAHNTPHTHTHKRTRTRERRPGCHRC